MALSGGPDSCALLLALTEAAEAGLPVPRPVAAAHFHHGLRGADADEDATFSVQLAEKLGIDCHAARGTVPRNTGRSPNDAARRARYAFLEQTARDFGATHLATGHTADDQAETVLGRVLRGTSVDGLAGIPVRRTLAPGLILIRPILGQRRADVEAYCAARGILPRRDPSNEKDRYMRSRLRKRLPGLAEEFNPNLVSALNRLAVHAALDSDYLSVQVDALWIRAAAQLSPSSLCLSAAILLLEHPALRRRVLLRGIYRVAESVGSEEDAGTVAWVEALDTLIGNEHGKPLTLPGRIRAERTRTHLFLTATETESKPVVFASETPISLPGHTDVPWANLSLSALLLSPGEASAPRLHRAPVIDIALPSEALLVVRPAQKGERMAPLGMKGKTRLVRDLLADAKISAEQRDSAPVVARADTGEVLWIIGVAQAETTRVSRDSAGRGRVVRLAVADNKGPV